MSDEKRVDRGLVLLTGCSGAIGRVVGPYLASRGWRVRGFDRAAAGGRSAEMLVDFVEGDLADRAAVDRAMSGVEMVIHLAANPHGHSDFLGELLEPNIVGVHHVYESALASGVRRVIAASSIQVVLARPVPEGMVGCDDPVRPGNHYAVTKVFAEAMGRMYHARKELESIAVRVGWFLRNEEEYERLHRQPKLYSVYLSRWDACRFFECALQAESVGFAALFATSRAHEGATVRFDLEPAERVIGYVPRDVFPADARPSFADDETGG